MSQAVGLGRLVAHSGLDEPFNGEIELLAPSAQELKTLTASLAARADFDAAGIERPPHLLTIKYTVSKRSDGRHVLHLTTDQPLREPFLHFLLQVEWVGGRVVREFTALLDPPHWVAGKPARAEAPRLTPKPPLRDSAGPGPASFYGDSLYGPPHLDGTETDQVVDPFSDQVKPPPTSSSDWAVRAEYGPVKSGDTLVQITGKMRVDKSLSVEQAMLALLKANPGAFFGNNINNLKTGRILKIPERSEVESISKAQAHKEVRAQYDAWQEYKLKLAGAERVVKVPAEGQTKAPAVSKPDIKKSKSDQSAAKAATTTKDKPAADNALLGKDTGSDDLLRIVRANLNEDKKPVDKKADVAEGRSNAKTERQALSDKVSTLEEAVQSKELENKELRERVGILQQQVENTTRLIELENKELAVKQQQAAGAPPPQVATSVVPAEVPAAKPAAAVKTPAGKPVAVPPARKLPPAPPAGDKGFMGFVDELTANPLILAVVLAVVLSGAALLVIYIRRRNRAKAEFAESILSGGALDTGSAGAAAPAASDTSFLSDFSHGGMGTIHHTDEVDPVAEAEVYLAYGRDEQAEEILKEAIVKEPVRHELKQKLLEIYHHRNDLRSFETLAEELYAALEGKGGKIWEKVEEMGRKMSPNNPMFRGGAPVKAVSEPPTAVFSPAAPKVPAAATSAAAAAISAAFNETLGGAKQAATPAPPAAPNLQDTGLSLDLGTPAVTEPAPPSDISFDFDLAPPSQAETGELVLEEGGDLKPAGSRDEELVAEERGADDGFISFDTEASAGAVASTAEAAPAVDKDWDETATKLDLAKAYIDMGDNEGARSILDEVITEGSDQQQQQARDLVAQMV